MKKEFIISIFIILAPLLIVMGGIEIGFRWFKVYEKKKSEMIKSTAMYDVPGIYYEMLESYPEMEYSSYLGYQPIAGGRGRDYTTNSNGFRYEENLNFKKEKDEYRIFVTGGSTAWGNGVKQDWLYSTDMEQLFRKLHPGKKIRVIDAGVGGYVSIQERILIENRIIRFNPDMIIMFSGNNDTYAGYRGQNVREDHDFMNYRVHIDGTDKSKSPLDPPDPEQYNFKTLFLFKNLMFYLRWRNQREYDSATLAREIPYSETLEIFLENVHIVEDIAKRKHFKLVMFLQPSFHATKKPLCRSEKDYEHKWEKYHWAFIKYNKDMYDLYRRTLPKDARESGYVYLDGDEAIQNINKCLFIDNAHFGDRGNRYIGGFLVQKIEELNLLGFRD